LSPPSARSFYLDVGPAQLPDFFNTPPDAIALFKPRHKFAFQPSPDRTAADAADEADL